MLARISTIYFPVSINRLRLVFVLETQGVSCVVELVLHITYMVFMLRHVARPAAGY